MAGKKMKYTASLDIDLNVKNASNQLKDLQRQLQEISTMKINVGNGNLTADIEKASQAAMKLSASLATATRPDTGKVDFTKFYSSIQKSGQSLEDYGKALQRMGPAGQKAFIGLADQISKAEIPLKRTSKLVDGMWDNLKKTIGWQISSSVIHSFMGTMQQAVGYAKDLDRSLTDIRIVTGQSSEQMASFAKEANKAAKQLSTTTTDYTRASLIYYQQGLSDAEVKARTETTIKMANATRTSAREVSDQMTAIWNNYDNGTKSLTHYADVMTALGAATASSTDEIAQGLQKFASISNTVGLSYEYAASALATVTSTSRESADVVGNAFKTLFSRIQGLQLGETLDDGTDLNKYSRAMNQVGISIKDSNGQLKDMDDILDEMGSKWKTLEKDEKFALAQTVAGVRQYTQLITLMDNWDKFKSNLTIANTSAGTLDSQAAIYAESWDAAANRVRASWEGLWDNLISSDGFSTVLDVTAELVGLLDNMVTGLGGASGTLLTFGGILTKVFNKQIASSVSDISYSISMLFPNTLKRIKQEQINFVEGAKSILHQNYDAPLYGPAETEARKISIESSINASQMFLENKEHMSEEQLMWEEMFSKQAQIVEEKRIQAAHNLDTINNNISDNFFSLYSDQDNLGANYLNDNQFFTTVDELKRVNELKKKQLNILKKDNDEFTQEDLDNFEQIEKEFKSFREKSRPKGKSEGPSYEKEIKDKANTLGDLYRGLNDAIQFGGDPDKAKGVLESFNKAFKAATNFDEKNPLFKLLSDFKNIELSTNDNGKQVISQENISKMSQILPQLQNYNEHNLKGLANQISDRILLSGNFAGSDEDASQMRKHIQEITAGYYQKNVAAGYLNSFNGFEFNPNNPNDIRVQNMLKKETQNKAEAAVAGTQGVMQILAAVEAFKALGNEIGKFKDGTASLSSVLSSIGSLSLNAASGFQGLHLAMSMFIKNAGAATKYSMIAAGIIASIALVGEAFDYFTTSSEESVKSAIKATQNLQNTTSSLSEQTEHLSDNTKTHLDNVKKIESWSQDPNEKDNAIYEANKQSIDMISNYGKHWIEGQEYTIDQNNGLIKIKEDVLRDILEQKENNALDFERTLNISNALEKIEKAQSIYDSFWEQDSNYKKKVLEEIGKASESKLQMWKSEGAYIPQQNGVSIYSSSQMQEMIAAYQMEQEGKASLKLNSQLNVQKILQDEGYLQQNIKGYNFLQNETTDKYNNIVNQKMEEYSKGYVGASRGWIDQLSPEAIKMAENYLKAQGHDGIQNLKYRSGEINYYSEDTEGKQSIEWSEVKRYYAEQEAKKAITEPSENGKNFIENKRDEIANAYANNGEKAEAILSIEKLGNIAGASVASIQALYNEGNNKEEFEKLYKNNKDAFNKDYALAERLFGESGIVKALGLDSATLSEVSKDTLETLQNQSDAMGPEGLSTYAQLFSELKEATNADTPEELAKITTALSSIDFSKDTYSNLSNLKSIFEEQGLDFDISNLESYYAILDKLASLTPGKGIVDLADAIKEVTENRGSLNKIKPNETVDEATRNAGIKAGLESKDFVKNENGDYVYVGSQEKIKYSQDSANRNFANEQFLLNQAQHFYEEAFGDVGGQTYESFQDLYNAAVQQTEVANFVNKLGLDLSSSDSSIQDQILKAYNQAIENGQMSDISQAAGIQDYIAQITSASDMMNAIRNNLFSGNGFINNDGIISDEVMGRLEAFPPTSERAAAAFDVLKNSRENYQQAFNSEDSTDDAEARDMYNQAMSAYDLATAIDAVAEARGLDAEAVAYHTEQIQNSLDKGDRKLVSSEELANMGADLAEQETALAGLREEWSSMKETINSTLKTSDKGQALRKLGNYLDDLTNSSITAGKSFEQLSEGYKSFIKNGGNMQKILEGDRKEITKLARAMGGMEKQQLKANKTMTKGANTFGDLYDAFDEGMKDFKSGEYDGGFLKQEDFVSEETLGNLKQIAADAVNNYMAQGLSKTDALDAAAADLGIGIAESAQSGLETGFGNGGVGIDGATVETESSNTEPKEGPPGSVTEMHWACTPVGCEEDHSDHELTTTVEEIPGNISAPVQADGLELYPKGGAPKGKPAGGSGGGAKQPKKVANKRKSQTVKRYKKNDYHRQNAGKAKKSEENKKDYLYGESKIAQMEKINKLAQKEATITSNRIKESQQYLVEDRKNLIKYMQKYGFEAEFDSDGFLSNYEKVWTKIYEEIAALYEDNLLTEDEEKIEEDLNIKLEELEGALEDYENSLSELADDIEKYEESLYEMYDNKVEQLEHKVQFKIELEEDDMSYLDFWIESLGDNVYNAIEAIEAMGAKANALFGGLEAYKEGIEEIYALSDDPLQTWATGGLEDVLTEAQVEALRENRDGLADYMQQLIDLREEIKDKVIDTFDAWQEKIEATSSSLQHYTSVIEHFKNMIDTIGKDPLGLNDQFMSSLEQSAIDQSMDIIDANKAYYESLAEQQLKAQEELNEARERGDKSSEAHWEEVVRTTTEAMETAQDELLSSLDTTLNLIAEQFEVAMQRAVDAFNENIYEHGGLEGLANDYNMIRENADLMAQDYEKIYELSKLTRDINKVLDDTNIVAGKKKMTSLLKEVNELQASGVELSKHDLEYLRAKYELRLAEIELENAQNSKDTVRLSKDSEGNWSYVYTQNAEAVETAEQKYEDALYNMQNLSQEYLEEMSSMMLDTSQAMMEELSALRIQDFASYEDYQAEVKRIQEKYAEALRLQENELNKAINNSAELYEKDWQAYSTMTGYKISLADKWIDKFKETTMGDLLDSDTIMSSFGDTLLGLTDQMSESLAGAAIKYFENIDSAFNKYGTSIDKFGNTVSSTVDKISNKSQNAATEMKEMAEEMKDAFAEITDYVSDWQEDFSKQIDDMLTEIKDLIQSINEAIRKSAELSNGKTDSSTLIGTDEAIEQLNNSDAGLGKFSKGSNGQIIVDGKTYSNWMAYNGKLIEDIDAALTTYANAHTGTPEREKAGEILKDLFKKYHAFRDIVNRIYENGSTLDLKAPEYSSFDTGGYTGEWGKDGRMAMLHEKELVLNAEDTKNFLDALNISKQVINSMIEMNARASSLGLGQITPGIIKDQTQTLEQQVMITAEFPSVTDHNEIEEAINDLLNTASQYANKIQ